MIFPFSSINELCNNGWTVFDSPSHEDTKASLCALPGPVIMTTRVAPKVDAKAALATDREMELHTDHPRARWIAWHCVRQSSEGGVSLLKDARAALRTLDPAIQLALRETTMGSHQVFPGDQERYPVVRSAGTNKNWIYYTPWLCRAGADPVLDAFTEALGKAETIEVRLRPGQALVINNSRMLHGRSSIGGDRDRLLIRYWIADGSDNFSPERGW